MKERDTVVVGGPASNGIGEVVAETLDLDFFAIDYRQLPDGESYIKLPPQIAGKNVILVQSTQPPQDEKLIQLFLILDLMQRLKARKTILVVPYLAYSRQNKEFTPGEAVSIETILKILGGLKADGLVVAEPHRPESLKVFNGKTKIIYPSSLLAKSLPQDLVKPIVISPDNGGISRADELAKVLGASSSFLGKERNKQTGEVKITKDPETDVTGHDIIIVDDIISTGETIRLAAEELKKLGAKRIFVIATHLLMLNGAFDKLKAAGVEKIIGSNSVPNDKADIVDISPLVAKCCSEMLKEK